MRAAKTKAQPTNVKKLEVLPGGKEKYQIIYEHASDAILTAYVCDQGLVIDTMNHAAEEMTGFMRDELGGKSISQLIPKDKIPSRVRALSEEFFKNSGTFEDVAILRQDGYVKIVDLSVRVADEKNHFIVALFRDVTEKKRMERELITKHQELRNAYIELEKKNSELKATQDTLVQAGKMAALGELAAGIAHELNQPLMSIRGYTQEMQYLLEKEIAGKPCENEVKVSIKEVISNSDKMSQIISHLRVFTRKSTEDFTMIDLRVPIEEAFKMVNRQLASRGIELERNFGDDVPQIYANSLQLEQVFINLTTNARDAIEATGRGKGKIKVTTRKVGEFAEVLFQDDGIGMTEKSVTKAFNPFFTTKEVGKGMGLGLSLSHGMISKIHGSIRIQSEMGKGTTFIIQLPKDFRELG